MKMELKLLIGLINFGLIASEPASLCRISTTSQSCSSYPHLICRSCNSSTYTLEIKARRDTVQEGAEKKLYYHYIYVLDKKSVDLHGDSRAKHHGCIPENKVVVLPIPQSPHVDLFQFEADRYESETCEGNSDPVSKDSCIFNISVKDCVNAYTTNTTSSTGSQVNTIKPTTEAPFVAPGGYDNLVVLISIPVFVTMLTLIVAVYLCCRMRKICGREKWKIIVRSSSTKNVEKLKRQLFKHTKSECNFCKQLCEETGSLVNSDAMPRLRLLLNLPRILCGNFVYVVVADPNEVLEERSRASLLWDLFTSCCHQYDSWRSDCNILRLRSDLSDRVIVISDSGEDYVLGRQNSQERLLNLSVAYLSSLAYISWRDETVACDVMKRIETLLTDDEEDIDDVDWRKECNKLAIDDPQIC